MKVIEKTMCKKETVYIRGKMEINILDNGKIMYSKEMESQFLLMDSFMKDTGKIIYYKVKENVLFLMEKYIKVNSLEIKLEVLGQLNLFPIKLLKK